MPFKPVFERRVNQHMTQDGRAEEGEGLASPRSEADAGNVEGKDIKQANKSSHEEVDIEISAKKERPPRFSTLFEPTSTTPQVIERYIEAPEKRRRAGVYLPIPVFVVLALVLFFESTLLFAYTMIGLYNNAPRGLLPFGGSATVGCECAGSGAGVNIAPNFYMAGAAPAPDLTTLPPSVTALTSTSSTTSSKLIPTTSSSTTANLSSILADLRSSLATSPSSSSANLIVSTTKVVVSTPHPKIVSITSQETVVAGQATSTSTKVVGRRGVQTIG